MKRRKAHATIIATGIRKKGNPSFNTFRNNQKLILLTTIFICGALLGVLFVKHSSASTFITLQNLVEAHFKQSETHSLWLNFLTSFGTESAYILVTALLGVCLVGEPFLWMLPLVKGLGVGAVSACLYKAYTLQGLQYHAALLLLPTVLSAAALLYSCKESILFSRDINRCLFKKTNSFTCGGDVKLYLLRHFVLLLVLLFAAAVSAISIYAWRGKLNLF